MVRKKRLKWFHYLLALVCGGGSGLGGWALKDFPFAQRLLARATGVDPDGGPLLRKDDLRDVVDVISHRAAYRKAGTFEVRLSSIKLDPAAFQSGQTVNLQVRLIKREADHRDSVVWESRTVGERTFVVGKAELQTGWDDQPIQVDWKPGDRFVVEVWDHKWLGSRKWFDWTTSSEETFPLASGTYTLSRSERGESTINSTENRFVLVSRPVAAHDKDRDHERSAEVAGQDETTIRIK